MHHDCSIYKVYHMNSANKKPFYTQNPRKPTLPQSRGFPIFYALTSSRYVPSVLHPLVAGPRDHVELLIGVSRLLSEGGVAVFSCNLRSFKPDVDKLASYGVAIEDISAQTIPHDFERNPKIHRCYLVGHDAVTPGCTLAG